MKFLDIEFIQRQAELARRLMPDPALLRRAQDLGNKYEMLSGCDDSFLKKKLGLNYVEGLCRVQNSDRLLRLAYPSYKGALADIRSLHYPLHPISHLTINSVVDSARDIQQQFNRAEKSFLALEGRNYFGELGLNYAFANKVQGRVSEFIWDYKYLVDSFDSSTQGKTSPQYPLSESTREFYTTGLLIDSLGKSNPSDEEITLENKLENEVEEVRDLLREIDPSLVNMYEGALGAFSRKNKDYKRHVLTSLRELWSHLIRRLAPDEEIARWTTDASFFNNNKPIRKARFLYICREVNSEPFSEFLISDTKTFLAFLDFFHRIHESEPGFTDEQLRTLILRTEAYLLFLLKISKN